MWRANVKLPTLKPKALVEKVINILLINVGKYIEHSGVYFLYNADVMTSALFGTFKNLKLSFPATCIYFGKVEPHFGHPWNIQ